MARRALQWIASWAVGEFLARWLWVPAITAGGVVIGWLENYPLFYLYIGAVILFAASSVAVLRFSEWRYRSRVADKLVFHSVRVGVSPVDSIYKDHARLGVLLQNMADFPLQVERVKFNTSLGNRYPPKREYEINQLEIPPHGFGFLDDHLIEINDILDCNMEGKIEYLVRYGRGLSRRHELMQTKKVFVGFNEDGVAPIVEWSDL